MSIGLRDITQLEEITEIPDDAEVIVITNGVAKKISKENAKFGSGGGGATIFYCQTSSETSYIQLLDSNGNAVEAQTAYDAAMSGPIYAQGLSSNASTYIQSKPNPNPTITEEGYNPLLLGIVVKGRGTMVSVMFICPILTGKYFYAGTDPSTLG